MTTDVHTLSGAYALDALSVEEAEQFRAHLEGCPVCAEEVTELQEVAALMGAAESMTPPPALKARVLAAADRMPQQPPKVTAIETVRRPGWLPRVAVAAAAAVVVVGGAVGIAQNSGQDEAPLAAPVSQVFEAADANAVAVDTPRGTVRVATSPGRGEMAVDDRGLEKLDGEHVYALWSIADGTPSLVGELEGDGSGASMPMPDRGTRVAITVEPVGTITAPTTDPIVEVDPSTV